jgi:alanyl-tRNA synthetase
VTDVQKDEGLVIHSGTVTEGTARPGPVTASVDRERRLDITSHHSATHLLHAGLGRIVGDHVEQQGSKVEAAALRFDFNNPRGLTNEQLAQVEEWVNQQITLGHAVDVRQMPVDAARGLGAKAQFGEKYGQMVRVITMGPETPVSRELCGGCHVGNTKDIRAFRIVKEEASAAGIRRITAVAGNAAVALVAHEAEIAHQVAELMGVRTVDDAKAVEQLAQSLKVPRKDLPGRLQQMQKEMHELAGKLQATLISASGGVIERFDHLQAELKRLRKMQETRQAQAAAGQADRLLEHIETVVGVPLLAAQLDGIDAKTLSQLAENLRGKRPSLCVVLGSNSAGKAVFVSAVSKDLIERGLSAGEMVKRVAESIGGRGGGRPDQAQAGAADGGRVAEALATVTSVVQQLKRS